MNKYLEQFKFVLLFTTLFHQFKIQNPESWTFLIRLKFVTTQQNIQKIRNWCNYVVNDEESTAKQPTHQFNCFFWERMYIWKLAVMISLFRGYGQIFVGTLLAQLTKYNKERGEIKEELL